MDDSIQISNAEHRMPNKAVWNLKFGIRNLKLDPVNVDLTPGAQGLEKLAPA